eukprot:13345541-Alexandrium_andersonii.AAC.1
MCIRDRLVDLPAAGLPALARAPGLLLRRGRGLPLRVAALGDGPPGQEGLEVPYQCPLGARAW